MIAITHPTTAHSVHTIWEETQIGCDEYKAMPMEQVRLKRQSRQEQQEIIDRQTMADPDWVMWDWQARCQCGRVREKDKMVNGQCEVCQGAHHGTKKAG